MQKKEIVIKLPRTWETQIKIMSDSEIADYLYNVIRNGTVLPDHGRLGDLDYLYNKFEANGCKDSNVYRLIKDEPTILEAWGE